MNWKQMRYRVKRNWFDVELQKKDSGYIVLAGILSMEQASGKTIPQVWRNAYKEMKRQKRDNPSSSR